MTAVNQREAAKKFVEDWKSRGDEKSDTQSFWLALLREVFGVAAPEKILFFEGRVKVDKVQSEEHKSQTNFIDARIPSTKVLIEQKSYYVDLGKAAKRSDGAFLTPFQQAKKYAAELPFSERPRWIVVCNFREFHVHDMEKPGDAPLVVKLEDLPKESYLLNFLVQEQSKALDHETEISFKAGEIVGKIYDAFLGRYQDPKNPKSLKSLNMLCVRLVFCLYAEDAEIFKRNQFHDYLTAYAVDPRDALIKLFKVLDQKKEERDPYLPPLLKDFPYVNGGLFKDENIEIPTITAEIRELILRDASEKFDWRDINPTIFGAVFESTLNPETRRQGGMHYTSTENIHKVIDPLFLDELRDEFNKLRELKQTKTRNERLVEFQEKLGSLTFLDPACGSGNFLTETYLSLRRLENEALRLIYPKGSIFSADDKAGVVKVSLDQFYGIEINDFAVAVAKTALWIAESQMLQETEGILSCQLDFLPLTNYDQIVEANALQIDWNKVVDKNKLNYIMGNPPFVGYSNQTAEQKSDVRAIYVDEKGKPYKTAGKIDYVACWYFKASQLIQKTKIKVAYVSTNSIAQGEQVESVWRPLISRFGIEIVFAYRSFRWSSEASSAASVHCVVIGFQSDHSDVAKKLYFGNEEKAVARINPYLLEASDVFIAPRSGPLCDVPTMTNGSKPTENGLLFLTEEERGTILKKEPELAPYVRVVYGSFEFINGVRRYCFWLVDASPHLLRSSHELSWRLEQIKDFRMKSPKETTRKDAETPWLFQQIRQPTTDYLLVPRVSSENRRYVPIDYVAPDVVATDSVLLIPNATLYHFGILTSSVHMGWMRTVCGRLKSDYRYSAKIVYNNFPWSEVSEEEQKGIAATGQGILSARKLYPESSLADLYDETTMPIELRKAHQENDKAVMKAYGFNPAMAESEIVAKLMERYEALTARK